MTAGPGEKRVSSFNTSAIIAYYHIPPVWIGTTPLEDSSKSESNKKFTKEIFQKELPQGIKVHVRRDGLFVFDFAMWEPGCSVAIPEISIEGDISDHPAVTKLLELVGTEQEKMYRRVEAINAHLACLYSCKPTVEPAYPIYSPSEHIALRSIEDAEWHTRLGVDYSPLQAFLSVHTEYNQYLSGKKTRGLLPLDVVECSFVLYQKLLNCHLRDALKLAVLLLRAANHCAEHDFASCIIFSWVVCERLIADLWDKFIQDNRARYIQGQSVSFINKDRKGRLENAGIYTAAVKIEVLSFHDLIPIKMYEDLTATRNSRNNWVHRLKPIDYASASKALRAAQDMLDHVGKVRLKLNPGAQASLVPSTS